MNLAKIGRLFFVSKQSDEPKPTWISNPKELLKKGLPERSYLGRKVKWDLVIKYLHCEISRNEILVLTAFEQEPANIWITVDVEKYPEIYYCAPDSHLIVKGEISSIQGTDIYINNCHLEIVPENEFSTFSL